MSRLTIVLPMLANLPLFHVDSGSPADGPGTAWSNAFLPSPAAWVTNGIHRLSSEIFVAKEIAIQSVNGIDPPATIHFDSSSYTLRKNNHYMPMVII